MEEITIKNAKELYKNSGKQIIIRDMVGNDISNNTEIDSITALSISNRQDYVEIIADYIG